MNLLLLDEGEAGSLIPNADRRHEHLRRILRKGPGDRVAAGLVVRDPFGPAPGSLGEAVVRRLDQGGLVLDYEAAAGAAGEPEPLAPLRLVLGFPRPIQAGRIFRDLASLGVAAIHLAGTELGEKSYLESSFFKEGEWARSLLEGAEQAANPRLPLVTKDWTLARALCTMRDTDNYDNKPGAPRAAPDWASGDFIVLHPGEAAPDLGSLVLGGSPRPVTLAIGSERGWTDGELRLLREAGYRQAGLGRRILKTETATLAAVALVLAGMGRM